uniref:Uncharacterized protein n=1 Tax=Anopheles farauti TaxID=69004 RepID=A0A182QD48_9DIPT
MEIVWMGTMETPSFVFAGGEETMTGFGSRRAGSIISFLSQRLAETMAIVGLSEEALHLVSLFLAATSRRKALLMSCGRFVRFLPALAIVVAFGRLRLGQLDGDTPGEDRGNIVQTLVAIVFLRFVILFLHLAQFDA